MAKLMGVRVKDMQRLAEERGIKPLGLAINYYRKMSSGMLEFVGSSNSIATVTPDLIAKETKLPDTDDASRLVAVHVTNRFPDNGVIRTTFSLNLTHWRDTVHFSLNAPINSHEYGNWDRKRYAVLVPFDKLVESVDAKRILGLRPEDTYLLGDVQLPEGSLVIAGGLWDLPPNLNPGKVVVGIENFSMPTQQARYFVREFELREELERVVEGLTPFRAGVYRAIVSMGYYPMDVMKQGWCGDDYSGHHDLSITRKLGLHNSSRNAHVGHWPSDLEGSTLELLKNFRGNGDGLSGIERKIGELVPADYQEMVMERFLEVRERFKGAKRRT